MTNLLNIGNFILSHKYLVLIQSYISWNLPRFSSKCGEHSSLQTQNISENGSIHGIFVMWVKLFGINCKTKRSTLISLKQRHWASPDWTEVMYMSWRQMVRRNRQMNMMASEHYNNKNTISYCSYCYIKHHEVFRQTCLPPTTDKYSSIISRWRCLLQFHMFFTAAVYFKIYESYHPTGDCTDRNMILVTSYIASRFLQRN